MDVLTTLIFFIVMMASFNHLFALPSTPLSSGKPSQADQKPTFTLKIAVLSDHMAKLFLGPTASLDVSDRAAFTRYMHSRFSGSPQSGYNRVVYAKSEKVLLSHLQDILSIIKKSFPLETKAVVAFSDKVTYQSTIDVLSAVRSLADDKQAVQVKAGRSIASATRVLFPEVIISEWSEGK